MRRQNLNLMQVVLSVSRTSNAPNASNPISLYRSDRLFRRSLPLKIWGYNPGAGLYLLIEDVTLCVEVTPVILHGVVPPEKMVGKDIL